MVCFMVTSLREEVNRVERKERFLFNRPRREGWEDGSGNETQKHLGKSFCTCPIRQEPALGQHFRTMQSPMPQTNSKREPSRSSSDFHLQKTYHFMFAQSRREIWWFPSSHIQPHQLLDTYLYHPSKTISSSQLSCPSLPLPQQSLFELDGQR